MPYDHKGEKRITTPEEARKWIDQEWRKISKPGWYRGWIMGKGAIAGWVISIIIALVFREHLPAWLIERGRRGRSLMDMVGFCSGMGVGWLVSRNCDRADEAEGRRGKSGGIDDVGGRKEISG